MWWADHAKDVQTYEELEKAGTGPKDGRVPALDRRPTVFPGNEWLFNAYLALDTCREIGMAVGPIPWLACREYCRSVLEVDDQEAQFIWSIIHRADTAVRAHKAPQES